MRRLWRRIPIPGESKTVTATCVEALWQGLKVFENCGIDLMMFRNDTMKNIKRTVRKFGKPLGHQYGVFSKELIYSFISPGLTRPVFLIRKWMNKAIMAGAMK